MNGRIDGAEGNPICVVMIVAGDVWLVVVGYCDGDGVVMVVGLDSPHTEQNTCEWWGEYRVVVLIPM